MTFLKNQKNIEIITGTSHPVLAQEISKILHLPVNSAVLKPFKDGEVHVQIPKNVRRKHVIIIQSVCRPDVNRYIIELELMIQAAKLSSANEITAIIPYFGYGRQDRKDQPRVPISGAWTAQKLAFAGADRLCTIDIHNEAMEGVVLNVPWDNLFASYTFVPVIRKLKLPNLMIATPDAGGVKRAIKYSELLGLGKNVAVASKYRDPNVKDVSKIIGLDADIKGKDIVIVDDIINTGITLNEPARIMKRMGARSIRAFVTHGLLVGNAKELLNKSDLDEIYITDTVPVPEWIKQSPKIKVISVAPLLAGAIERIETGESISDRFILQLHLGKKH
jgi:ribose-phosphate pyrophosphokinase